MAPLYEELCHELKWPVDQTLLAKMKKANEEKVKELGEKLKYAEENLGETEVRDALYSQGEYLCSIGDKVKKKITSSFHVVIFLSNLLQL